MQQQSQYCNNNKPAQTMLNLLICWLINQSTSEGGIMTSFSALSLQSTMISSQNNNNNNNNNIMKTLTITQFIRIITFIEAQVLH